MLKSKRAQVSIFIIIAVLIFGGIALFFVFSKQTIPETTQKSEENPENFLESCIEDKVKNAINEISFRGGYPDNKLSINFKFEEDEKYYNISYLCYSQRNYVRCLNQKPGFTEDIKKEVKKYISEGVEGCFNEMNSDFIEKGYETNTNYKDFEVEIIPKRVIVLTDSKLSLKKSGETSKQEDFIIEVASRLYEISFIVHEIVNQETRFCYAEDLGIMMVYPEFLIDKFKTEDSTTIYTVEHKDSKEKFRFAIRGCAIPPGMK